MLFRSKEGYADGEQLRDFIYVKDVIAVCYWLMSARAGTDRENKPASAIYNVGTGIARSFNDLVNQLLQASICSLKLNTLIYPKISVINTSTSPKPIWIN